MRFIITGRNIDITEGLKAAVEEKLGKLDRFFAPETEVNVTLSVEKERQKIEVTIPVKGNIIRSEHNYYYFGISYCRMSDSILLYLSATKTSQGRS